jgi:type I restriction enzyme M protein
MAVKKSELYSTLWESCNQLRGGMDASQYKDYVLALLFIKYVSDKYAGVPFAPITIPEGATFRDMVALKGNPEIGDKVNKLIFEKIRDANKMTDFADFNDDNKLGTGKDKVDRITNLISIFDRDELDFSKNRADDDDLLGDAYEFLMRHFATESGKSKGQFYTPSEVSRVLSKILGISKSTITASTSFYDPTAGSASLLIKAGEESGRQVTLYGQEMDIATVALAAMNMVLHNQAHNLNGIKQGNTIADPKFLNPDGTLMTFDYSVANPPFSLSNWTNGLIDEKSKAVVDKFNRFSGYGIPPDKNGDYAFLLHIIKSLKSNGKGAIILPHGVLFRGNAESAIRTNLIKKGLIKGIIGLPANLFYGTGIPACIIMIDKENTSEHRSIFMIDASKGYIKDGNKNRLREQDIHKIVDVFTNQIEIPGYSRLIPYAEISDPKNDFNLNIPRYIDNQEQEDIQDIAAHLFGGIPAHDIDMLQTYWTVYPSMRNELFDPIPDRPGYYKLTQSPDRVRTFIMSHHEYNDFNNTLYDCYSEWSATTRTHLFSLEMDMIPKRVIHHISEQLLTAFSNVALIDKYDIYQHLMDYWNDTMQDDCYLVAADGWKAELKIIKQSKSSVEYDCELLPKTYVIDSYFHLEKQKLSELQSKSDSISAELEALVEEYSGEDGYFSALDKINKNTVAARLKTITPTKVKKIAPSDIAAEPEVEYGEPAILRQYIELTESLAKVNLEIKTETAELDQLVIAKYPTLSIEDIKSLVIGDKWLTSIRHKVDGEIQRLSQTLTQRIKELGERYDTPVTTIMNDVSLWESKVNQHLAQMGFPTA